MSKVISRVAYVANANTPQSDLQQFVLHTVEGFDQDSDQSVKINLFAQCPQDAISRASYIDSQFWLN